MRGDMLAKTSRDGSVAASLYEDTKRQHLQTEAFCSQAGFAFLPIVVEAHGGGWGQVARKAFGALAKRVAERTGDDAGIVADMHAQRLSILLQKENARAVLKRLSAPHVGSACISAAAVAGIGGGELW